ncbi:MAG: fibronectin [Pedosphaera sp.]|nr:fibronectin [Pedosphaera sp.]
MICDAIKNHPWRYSVPLWLLTGLFCLFAKVAQAGDNGQLPEFNTTRPYCIYYGNWTTAQVNYARTNYHLVILHPASNITSNQIATIRSGKDGILGTADDVRVLAYLSIGEDDRNGAPVVGDRMGPRVDPRTSDSLPLGSITNAIGSPSAGGTNYASYYLNAQSNQTGIPDKNANFGSYYVNAGSPAWWTVLQTMTKATSGQSGLQEILSTNYGNALNCDGVFLDTVDTAAPNTWGTPYEWTAPGMQSLIQQIHTNYPGKLLMANRGLFFFDPNLKTYPYSIRPFVDMVMFESYYSDTSTNLVSLSFHDNKYDFAPKLNAEAGRPDGFNLFVVDYDHTPPQPAATVNQDYVESMGIQGWPLYRTNPYLDQALNTSSAAWLATNVDAQPPVWDSTAATGPALPAPRVGVQEAVAGNGSVTVYWDVARDQTGPVYYNLYYSTGGTVNFATATKLSHLTPGMPANYNYPTGTGPGVFPYCYTVTGLQNGLTYAFAVRAEDRCSPAHEDTNAVSITVAAGTNVLSTYKKITVDGSFADWTGVPWAYQGTPGGNPVNYIQVQFANDTNYLYGHVILASPYALFSDYYSHLFFDTDLNAATGYLVTGALFGSEMMIESGYGYDQRNGSFNAGAVSNLGWAVAPLVSATEFEFQVSLAARYPDNSKVFGGNPLRLLLQDNRGPETAVETGIEYQIAPPQLGSLFITQSNSVININWTGPGTLQSTASLTPPVWTSLTTATNPYSFTPGSGQQFFRLTQ